VPMNREPGGEFCGTPPRKRKNFWNSEYVYHEAIEAVTDHALVLAGLVVGS